MKKTIFSFLVLLTVGAVHAETVSPNEMFAQANQLFEKGEIQRAEEIYSSLVSQGFESSDLYYNMGNLQYRKGERGKAVLWYERAARLSPRDSDIKFNLGLARSHIKDDDSNFLHKVLLYASGNELGLTLTVLIWLFFGMWGASTLGWIKSENATGITLWFSGFLLLITGGWFGANVVLARQPYAVVVNPPGEVRNGPGADYAVGFTIPEGSKVLVLNKRPEWTQVGVPSQGLKGWMPNTEIQTIISDPSLN